MKLLHTADWHLGKTLKGEPLIDDQKHIINEIFKVIDDAKPDAILIAGDIYDRGIPPLEAVNLLDETLNKIAEKKIPTLIIAGNHDSATRLNFGSKIFESQKIFIAAKVADEPAQVVLEDKFGAVYFTLIPYFDFGDAQAKLSAAREKIPSGKRSVAVAHMFLTGGIESESERKFVGGAANVDAKIFSGYDYVALGHLHCPHVPEGAPRNIRYAGSLLKYSFDEEKHKKGVTLVELDESGFVNAKNIPLTPRRDVRVVKGTLHELLQEPPTFDYILAKLTKREINVQDKLARIFPHLLSVEFDLPQNSSANSEARVFREGTSTLDYFADFFKDQTGEELNGEYRAAVEKILSEIDRDEREV